MATVRPDPATLEIGEGQIETLVILLENARDAYGIDIRGSFDPQVVEIVPIDAGAPLRAGGFIKPDFVVVNAANNVSGTFQWAATQVNPTAPVNGSGPILSIQFRGRKRGASAPITISAVELASRAGAALPVSPQSGSIAVVAPKPIAAGPTSTSLPLATSVLTPGPGGVAQAPAAAVIATKAATAAPEAPRDWTAEIVGGVVLLGLVAAIVFRRRRPASAG